MLSRGIPLGGGPERDDKGVGSSMTISDGLHYIPPFLDDSGDAYKRWDDLTLKAGVRFVPYAHAVRFAA